VTLDEDLAARAVEHQLREREWDTDLVQTAEAGSCPAPFVRARVPAGGPLGGLITVRDGEIRLAWASPSYRAGLEVAVGAAQTALRGRR
jgi:hypothetical protein